MAKSKERKPLPNPKKWKKCKHPECLKETQKREEEIGDILRYPKNHAIFLEDYCWRHLPHKARVAYKSKIEEWIRQGRSLEGANLDNIDLSKSCLVMADLKGASLIQTNLQEANLNAANLENATLWHANLQKADLCSANLEEASLEGANLSGADLFEAWLPKSRLSGANLSGANLKEATLYGCHMNDVLLDGALYLTWDQIMKAGTDSEYDRDSYLRLKNYFHQAGRYEDESKAYYKEKLSSKHGLFELWFRGKTLEDHDLLYPPKITFTEKVKAFFKWLSLWFMHVFTGFGERWWLTALWAVGTFVFFGLLHWLGTNVGGWSLLSRGGEVKNIIDCLYFSLVTFVTLGFGDIWPEAWVAKIIVGFEVVLGYVFLGLIVTLIARKMGR